MSSNLQSILALVVVAIAVMLLARSFLKKRKNPGCGGECGCPTDTLKTQIKRQPTIR